MKSRALRKKLVTAIKHDSVKHGREEVITDGQHENAATVFRVACRNGKESGRR